MFLFQSSLFPHFIWKKEEIEQVISCMVNQYSLFTRHATLHLAVSVGLSVHPSRNIFEFRVVSALLLRPNRPRLDCRVSGLVLWESTRPDTRLPKSCVGRQRPYLRSRSFGQEQWGQRPITNLIVHYYLMILKTFISVPVKCLLRSKDVFMAFVEKKIVEFICNFTYFKYFINGFHFLRKKLSNT